MNARKKTNVIIDLIYSGLGGTGSLNLMLHLRGNQRDFDNWAKITGDSSWSYEAVVPHFKSHEKTADTSRDGKHMLLV